MRKTWPLWASGFTATALIVFAIYRSLAPVMLPTGLLYGNGEIEATEVHVAAEVTGSVLESNLIEGRGVKAGDLLVRLDDADLRTRLHQAEATVVASERAQARLARELPAARHHVETTRAEVVRYRQLRATGYVSAEAVDRAENQYREAQGGAEALAEQQAQAAASREAAAREVDLLRSQVGKAVIRAPITGTVLTKGVEVGELATPGRTIAVIADTRQIELKVYVPEYEIGEVKLDEPARVHVDAFPQRYFEARIARVDERAQFTPKDVHMPDERARLVFGVVLVIDNTDGYLKPGMPADAWIRWKPEAPWPKRLPVPR